MKKLKLLLCFSKLQNSSKFWKPLILSVSTFFHNFSHYSDFSGSDVSRMGNKTVHSRPQSTVRIQRKSFHLHGDIQRISSFRFPQRIDVSQLLFELKKNVIVRKNIFWMQKFEGFPKNSFGNVGNWKINPTNMLFVDPSIHFVWKRFFKINTLSMRDGTPHTWSVFRSEHNKLRCVRRCHGRVICDETAFAKCTVTLDARVLLRE